MHLACNHPCSLTSPRKLTKLPPWTDWRTAKPPRWKAFKIQIAFSPGRGERSLYTEFSHLIVLCIRCCVRATKNTSVLTVLTNIAFNVLRALMFVLTVSTKKIPYTIHNSIALILCIDHLNMPFNVNKVTMITVSGFLTI